MTELTVHVEKTIHAPIAKVFNAWLDPEMLAQFMLPMPEMEQPDIEIDPRVGGQFLVLMKVGDEKIPHTGEYLEIDPPNRLVFSWHSSHSSSQGSNVTLTFEEIDGNTTHVDLLHVRFPSEESRADHEGGWAHILDALSKLTA